MSSLECHLKVQGACGVPHSDSGCVRKPPSRRSTQPLVSPLSSQLRDRLSLLGLTEPHPAPVQRARNQGPPENPHADFCGSPPSMQHLPFHLSVPPPIFSCFSSPLIQSRPPSAQQDTFPLPTRSPGWSWGSPCVFPSLQNRSPTLLFTQAWKKSCTVYSVQFCTHSVGGQVLCQITLLEPKAHIIMSFVTPDTFKMFVSCFWCSFLLVPWS